MPSRSLRDLIPAVYRSALPQFFDADLVEERHATCEDCAMCGPHETHGSGSSAEQWFFSPATKCCTYYPDLPNFLVGAVLQCKDPESEEGRSRIRSVIRSRRGVRPHGLMTPGKYRLLYRNSTASFGRASSMVCPLFNREVGGCSIWPFREAVAITYYCKYVHGEDGRRFWRSLLEYLTWVQDTLTMYSLRRMQWPIDDILPEPASADNLAPRQLDEQPPDEHRYQLLWRDWEGREEELYQSTSRAVAELDRETFENLGGLSHTVLLERLERSYQRLFDPDLPTVLRRNPQMRVEITDNGYTLVSYLSTDPVSLRKPVYDLLDFFDGRRSTSEALEMIAVKRSQTLSPSLLKRLHQHRVLIDPTS